MANECTFGPVHRWKPFTPADVISRRESFLVGIFGMVTIRMTCRACGVQVRGEYTHLTKTLQVPIVTTEEYYQKRKRA